MKSRTPFKLPYNPVMPKRNSSSKPNFLEPPKSKNILEQVFEVDSDIKLIKIKHIEKVCLKRVFEKLCELENEASSDEDTQYKKYIKEIDLKANMKKMDPNSHHSQHTGSKIINQNDIFKIPKNKNEK